MEAVREGARRPAPVPPLPLPRRPRDAAAEPRALLRVAADRDRGPPAGVRGAQKALVDRFKFRVPYAKGPRAPKRGPHFFQGLKFQEKGKKKEKRKEIDRNSGN